MPWLNESNHVIQAVNTTATGAGLMGAGAEVRDPQGFLPACATVTIDTIDALRTPHLACAVIGITGIVKERSLQHGQAPIVIQER